MPVLMILIALCLSLTAADKTNFVVIFTDDMGYGDLQCFGAPENKTPNLDRMASEGMLMKSFYVASSVCSPSRAALLTGRYPYRIGIPKGVFFPTSKNGMPTSELTIAEVLKKKDYKTAIFGKWHLGHREKYLPSNQGFDYYYGIPYSNDMWLAPDLQLADNMKLTGNFTKEQVLDIQKNKKRTYGSVPLMRNNEVIEFPCDQRTITKRLTEEAVKYIEAKKNDPFFIYIAHPMPHIPLFASDDFKGKSANGLYGDVIEEIDWSTGQILKALKDNGLEENTFVLFTSDNGPWLIKKQDGGSAGPLRNGKGSTYEGGMRVPCVIKYPAMVKGGQSCDTLTSAMDVLPTLAELAGIQLNHVIDGHSLTAVLKDSNAPTLYSDFLYVSSKGTLSGIRQGDWKLLFGNPYALYAERVAKKKFEGIELYNLKDDLGETNNLASSSNTMVQQLKKLAMQRFNDLKN